MTDYTNTYDVGDLLRVVGTFTDSAGAVQDPTVIKLSTKDPAGTVTTYTYVASPEADIFKTATGIYYSDIDLSSAGTWYYRWWSTGTGQASGETRVEVRKLNAV